MEKQRLFKIMANMDRDEVSKLAYEVKQNYEITVVKPPHKTLTMVKVRESVKQTLFYLGEVIVSEAIIEIQGTKGMAVTMGDDFDKVLDMAIIDCAFNIQFDGCQNILNQLLKEEHSQRLQKEKINAVHLKTMVNFNTMSGGEA